MATRAISATAENITKVKVDDDGRETWSYDFCHDGDFVREVFVTVMPHFNLPHEVYNKIRESLEINVKQYEVETLRHIVLRLR